MCERVCECVCMCVCQAVSHPFTEEAKPELFNYRDRTSAVRKRKREERHVCLPLCEMCVCLCKIEMYLREHVFVCVSMGEKSGITQVVGMLSHYGRHPSNEDKKQVP